MWPRPSATVPGAPAALASAQHRLWLVAASAIALLAVALVVLAPSARANAECDVFASPAGSDTSAGTYQNPFRTVQQLVDSLGPGRTGCLLAGNYYGNVRIANGGRPGARATVTVAPGQAATVVGRLEIVKGANYVTVSGLTLDGRNTQHLLSPMIDSNHDTFSDDNVTDHHTGVCFGIGSPTWGWATGTLITHSRVHDCGQMTPGDNYQHGFYIGAATDTRIEWNLIYNNAARGIQLYPDARYTTIDHNIIDGNGEGIIVAGTDGEASSHTDIYDNALSNATVRHDVESWWPVGNPVGVDNVVHDNCLWGGREGTMDTSGGGLRAWDNLTINPRYAYAKIHDYEMSPNSLCLALVGDVQAAVDNTSPVQPASAALYATRRALARAAAKHQRHHRRAHRSPRWMSR